MSGELLTSDQAAELASSEQAEEARRQAIELIPIPVTIRVKNWGTLNCSGDRSWGYTPYGVFATGVKQGHDYGDADPAEHDVLFPYNQIIAIEFDYPAFFKSQGLNSRGEKVEEADGNEDSGD